MIFLPCLTHISIVMCLKFQALERIYEQRYEQYALRSQWARTYAAPCMYFVRTTPKALCTRHTWAPILELVLCLAAFQLQFLYLGFRLYWKCSWRATRPTTNSNMCANIYNHVCCENSALTKAGIFEKNGCLN